MSDVTQVLNAIDRGEPKAADELLPLVYEQLRKLAEHKMASEPAGQTLQPTALVHEAWLRVGAENQKWDSRGHFFSAAAEAMRRILIDNARRKHALRHGGGQQRLNIDQIEITHQTAQSELLAVDEALEKLGRQDAKKAELVKLRYFGGLTVEQAATVLGISSPTAKRWWAYARAWLFQEISSEHRSGLHHNGPQ